MLCSVKELNGFELAARDGEIGHAREVYFDDERWVVRHLVADTSDWLSGRQVLISPHSIQGVDRAARKLAVSLTREQIERAPGKDADKPVSRQHEIPYYDYYGYPYYWSGTSLWGMEVLPLAGADLLPRTPPEAAQADASGAENNVGDRHLRSSAEVIDYTVEATDGSIGHIADFLIDDQSWQIQLVVVDTHNWLPDRLVLVSPLSISAIDWAGNCARVNLTREAIKGSPPYERSASLSREDAERVHRHYSDWR